MTSNITNSDSSQSAAETAVYLFDDWFDPIEALLLVQSYEVSHTPAIVT
jgi:hypothetical protein